MSDWSTARIFFPGPTWVAPEVREAMAAHAMHHRTPEFRTLHARVIEKLQSCLDTRASLMLSTASGTGMMELAVRNLSAERVLCVANGAFGERLHKVAEANGKAADLLGFEWGRGVETGKIAEALERHRYDLVTVVHNETSTGVENPIAEIAPVVRAHPDTLLAVDAVSSLGGAPLAIDALGIDLVFAGVQKCFALPPGLSIVAASARAIERARRTPDRGTYFDLVKMAEAAANHETPWTPSIPHIAALDVQLDRMMREGMEARYRRHLRMAEMTREWAHRRMGLFAEEGFRSRTVTAIRNTLDLDLKSFLAELRGRGFICASGYGVLRDRTFRIGHMGDLQPADVEALLAAADDALGRTR